VLAELGVRLDDATEVRVLDASGHSRWFVVPSRPNGTEEWTEEQLAELVTTESMIGVALVDPAAT
jgi:nitrile hydratase